MSVAVQISLGLMIGVGIGVVFITLCVITASNSGPNASKLGGPFTRKGKKNVS